MIRINLLPPEIAQRVIRRRLISLGGFAGGVIVGILAVVFVLRLKVDVTLAAKIAVLERELKEYRRIAEDVKKLREIKADLESKKGVIEKLRKKSLLYPKFVEEFMALVPETIWFTMFNTQTTPEGLSVNISCTSLDNFSIADFISNLETSPKFSNIEIDAIVTGAAGPSGRETFSFNLKFNYKAEL